VMRHAGEPSRLAFACVDRRLLRGGLRIQEALRSPSPTLTRGAGRCRAQRQGWSRREIGWTLGLEQKLRSWLASRRGLPVGPLFCVMRSKPRPTLVKSAVRVELRRLAARQGYGAGSHHTTTPCPRP